MAIARMNLSKKPLTVDPAPVAADPKPAGGDFTPARLLTPGEVGDMLGVGRKVLERWRSIGHGPVFVRLTTKTIRYPAAEVAQFLATRTVTPAAPSAAA